MEDIKIEDNVVCGGPSIELPAHLSFGKYFLEKLRNTPTDRVVLINGDNGHKTTCEELLQEIVNVASGLQRIGVKQGDVVALCSENRVEFISAAMGALCCGSTLTNVSTLYTIDEIIHVLDISRPSLICCSEAALERFLDVIKTLPYIKNIIQLNGKPVGGGVIPYSDVVVETDTREYNPPAVVCGADTAFILYSSGTTGLPKGVMLTHTNVLNGVKIIHESSIENHCKVTITVLPWYHVYGLLTTLEYIMSQMSVVYFSQFKSNQYLYAIQEYKANVIITVPPIVVFLAKSPLVKEYDLSSVFSVWCASAPLSAETTSEAIKCLPNCTGIFQGYGLTETAVTVLKDLCGKDAEPKTGSSGYPLAGVKVKVVDITTRKKLGAMQEGEVCVKSSSVMKGYIGDEAAYRDIIDEEGYLKTGDIGYYDDDGCFFIVDRYKEIIKYKGYQVSPASVERVVMQHVGVAECGVVGTPDELAGELPTAFVVVKPGAALTVHDLQRFTDERLSPVNRLRGGFIFVNEVPRSPSGKILRRQLKQMLHDLHKT